MLVLSWPSRIGKQSAGVVSAETCSSTRVLIVTASQVGDGSFGLRPNQTDDGVSNLLRAFPVREVPNTFEQEPLISSGKIDLKTLRLFWVIARVGPALNHKSRSRQTLHFTEPPLQ